MTHFRDWQKQELELIGSHMNGRSKLSLSAVCGRNTPSGTLYQVVMRGHASTEGVQLRINLTDAALEGVAPQSFDRRNI